jgi:hypothetical protein
MSMGVTLRPDGMPNVYVKDDGDNCDLKMLDAKIRALQQARSWLKKELALKEQVNKK